jgi:hypothetical protein
MRDPAIFRMCAAPTLQSNPDCKFDPATGESLRVIRSICARFDCSRFMREAFNQKFCAQGDQHAQRVSEMPELFCAVRVFPTMQHPLQGIECLENPFNMGISEYFEKLHRRNWQPRVCFPSRIPPTQMRAQNMVSRRGHACPSCENAGFFRAL